MRCSHQRQTGDSERKWFILMNLLCTSYMHKYEISTVESQKRFPTQHKTSNRVVKVQNDSLPVYSSMFSLITYVSGGAVLFVDTFI